MTSETYRNRIYKHYVQARTQSFSPVNLAGLASRAPYLRKLISNYFPTNKAADILDLGCGHGALLHFAREAGYTHLRGVDGSPEQVEAAKMLGVSGVEEGDLWDVLTKQPNDSIDVIVTFDVIEHFTRDELLPFVDAVRRVLKPEGQWIIHVPNGESPFFGGIRYGDLTHELAFTSVSLSQLLLSSCFKEVLFFEDEPIVHGVKSALRWIIWKSFRGLLRLYIAAETGDISRRHIFSQNLLAVARK